MPLKHTKETFLLLLLGVLFGVTGISAHLLPPLPEGAILWGGLWILTLLYPLLLYPYLRYHRADYLFRILHFLPATLVVLWLLFALIAFAIPSWEVAFRWYVWGFSASAHHTCHGHKHAIFRICGECDWMGSILFRKIGCEPRTGESCSS